MPDPVVLKKYSNRRLYDTRNSRYVTLEDVARMIRDGEQVQINDAKSGEDVTAFILTQVVLEAARRRNSLLPVSVLHLIIRHGDDALGEYFEKYFQKTIQNYLATKEAFERQFGRWLDMGLDMSQRMPEMMANASSMDAIMEMFGFAKPPATKSSDTVDADPSRRDDGDPKAKG